MTSQNPLVALKDRFEAIRPDLEHALAADPAALGRVSTTADALRATAADGRLNTIVFGNYNAGKSTFINALLGQELAQMGDVPLTASVDSYEWEGHVLFDTPGIDAPIAHEKVTDDFIERRCHAVIYIVPTGGAVEEAKTWERLCGFVAAHKAVLIVVNDRGGQDLNSVDFAELRNTIYANMQAAAQRLGTSVAPEQIDVLHVKARTALKARLENKRALLQSSGIVQVEGVLRHFLAAKTAKVLAPCLKQASDVVGEAIAALSTRAGGDAGTRLAAIRNEAEAERQKLEAGLNEELDDLIRSETKRMRDAASTIATQGGGVAGMVTEKFDESLARIAAGLERQLNLQRTRADEVARRAATLLRSEVTLGGKALENVHVEVVVDEPAAKEAPTQGRFAGEVAEHARNAPWAKWTEKGAAMALQYGKGTFPDMFKGIGKKTMERWAGAAGKAVGPVVQVAVAGYQLVEAHRTDTREREAFEGFVNGVMETIRQAFGDAREEYQSMFPAVAVATLRPVLDALDARLDALEATDDARRASKSRLTNWTRELGT